MGTWSQPYTEERARQLEKLMLRPIKKKHSVESLYELLGNDDLFQLINECGEEEDVRPLVREHLAGIMASLHHSWMIWDREAIVIFRDLAKPSADHLLSFLPEKRVVNS